MGSDTHSGWLPGEEITSATESIKEIPNSLLFNSETRITSETGGQKGSKPVRLGLIDPLALEELGKVAEFGARKYAKWNYLKGFDHSLAVDAAFRHLLRHQAGETFDPESGLRHTAHLGWQGLCLTSFGIRGIGEDDRPPLWLPDM